MSFGSRSSALAGRGWAVIHAVRRSVGMRWAAHDGGSRSAFNRAQQAHPPTHLAGTSRAAQCSAAAAAWRCHAGTWRIWARAAAGLLEWGVQGQGGSCERPGSWASEHGSEGGASDSGRPAGLSESAARTRGQQAHHPGRRLRLQLDFHHAIGEVGGVGGALGGGQVPAAGERTADGRAASRHAAARGGRPAAVQSGPQRPLQPTGAPAPVSPSTGRPQLQQGVQPSVQGDADLGRRGA